MPGYLGPGHTCTERKEPSQEIRTSAPCSASLAIASKVAASLLAWSSCRSAIEPFQMKKHVEGMTAYFNLNLNWQNNFVFKEAYWTC